MTHPIHKPSHEKQCTPAARHADASTESKAMTETKKEGRRLTTETVEGTALALERVDNVERGDGLALGVLSVGDSIADDALKEGLEHTTGLLVDHCNIINIDVK